MERFTSFDGGLSPHDGAPRSRLSPSSSRERRLPSEKVALQVNTAHPLRDIDALILRERVRGLYDKGFVALVTNLVNAAILVGVLWSVLPHRVALFWLAAMFVVHGIRLAFWQRHRVTAPESYDSRFWARIWVVSASITRDSSPPEATRAMGRSS